MNQREDKVGMFELQRAQPRLFADRADAGRRLAQMLQHYRDRQVLVIGISRGGVPVALEIADLLDADLDVLVARKVGAPGQEELGLGAVTADGTRFLNRELIVQLGVSDASLDWLVGQQRAEAERCERRFRRDLPALDPTGRTVILVDDGLATGATLRAAIRSLRSRCERLVVAVPVGAVESCTAVEREVDEFVCPYQREPFLAVGTHYQTFGQTSDEDVEGLLAEHRRRTASSAVC